MKILLTSDCHGDIEKLEMLENIYPNMDLYFDLGDSNNPNDFIGNFATVRGNCDYFSSCPDYREIKIENLNILLTHKPQINLQKEFDIFIHGHTHVPEIELINNKLIICPGSISYPRSSYGQTYGIIEVSNNNISVKILSLTDNKVILSNSFVRDGNYIK